jgi:hypothetical protein
MRPLRVKVVGARESADCSKLARPWFGTSDNGARRGSFELAERPPFFGAKP